MNAYAALARQRKATALALALSRPSAGLSPLARQEALSTLAEAVESLVDLDSRAGDPGLYQLFDGAEVAAGVRHSSVLTWALVADLLRGLAGAAAEDPFEGLG